MVAVCLSVMVPGIDERPFMAPIATKLYVVVTVTVTVLFDAEPGVDAVAVTVRPDGASALTAADRLVHVDGSENPALE